MEFYERVKIPVFGASASPVATFTIPSETQTGTYFTDDAWNSESNYTRMGGVSEGIARSIDYNTVMRQCSAMSSLLANIASYRNGLSSNPYGGSADTYIGTEPLTSIGEQNVEDHIRGLTSIFSSQTFLIDGEVTTRTIATDAVTTAKITDGAITTAKVSDDQITKAKLGSDLISTGSASANGISISLSQGSASGNHGLVLGISSTKVNSASQSDNSTNADNIKTTTSSSNLYLCGTTTTTADTYKGLCNTSNVYISGGSQVNANSFNVLSDVRLKENITDVGKHQVKNLVENTDVKLFNYKSAPNETTIGLMAQDILKSNSPLADLLVFKPDSKSDILGIHEDKLVYVLWNYVQQQNKEIEELRNRIKKLED